jgi:hypothetical protein
MENSRFSKLGISRVGVYDLLEDNVKSRVSKFGILAEEFAV